jgi:hypothetical protein
VIHTGRGNTDRPVPSRRGGLGTGRFFACRDPAQVLYERIGGLPGENGVLYATLDAGRELLGEATALIDDGAAWSQTVPTIAEATHTERTAPSPARRWRSTWRWRSAERTKPPAPGPRPASA